METQPLKAGGTHSLSVIKTLWRHMVPSLAPALNCLTADMSRDWKRHVSRDNRDYFIGTLMKLENKKISVGCKRSSKVKRLFLFEFKFMIANVIFVSTLYLMMLIFLCLHLTWFESNFSQCLSISYKLSSIKKSLPFVVLVFFIRALFYSGVGIIIFCFWKQQFWHVNSTHTLVAGHFLLRPKKPTCCKNKIVRLLLFQKKRESVT